MTNKTCRNGHDLSIYGSRANGNGCNECKRIASAKYRARRKEGIAINALYSHARTDLGYDTLKGA